MTICNQWAWKPNDEMKSLKQCLQTLVLCAGGDGNLLFNVGPTPEGIIEPRQVNRLREMGVWLRKYGETIYGTRGGPWKPTKAMASTRTGNTVYVHLLGEARSLTLTGLPKKILHSSLLTGGKPEVSQSANEIKIAVPHREAGEIDTIVALEFEGSVMGLPALSATAKEDAQATASNIFQNNADFEPAMAFDEDPETRWATDQGTGHAWITRNLGRAFVFDGVRIDEAYGKRIQHYEFQIKEGNDWKTVFEGTTVGPGFSRKFPAVTAKEIRLNIRESVEGPTITEIRLDEVKPEPAHSPVK